MTSGKTAVVERRLPGANLGTGVDREEEGWTVLRLQVAGAQRPEAKAAPRSPHAQPQPPLDPPLVGVPDS